MTRHLIEDDEARIEIAKERADEQARECAQP